MNKARRWKVLALFAALALALVACGGGDGGAGAAGGGGGSEPIVIGVFGGMESPAGNGIRNAAQMAIDEINEAGGVHGRQLEMIVRDTQLDPQQAVAAYQRLGLSDGATAAVGIWSSGESFAIMDSLSRVRLPFLNTGSAATNLADLVTENYEAHKYWFRFMHNGPEQAAPVINFIQLYMAPELGVERVAIFSEDAVWTEDIRQIMRDQLDEDPNLELVAEELFDVQTTDFNPIFRRLLDADPDHIIEISSHVDSAGYTRQWADLQPAPMGGIAVSQIASTFFEETGGAAAGEWTIHYGYPVPITEKTIPFYDKYVETFDIGPNYTSWYTYDAMYALREALERMDPAEIGDPDVLVEELEATDYEGVLGEWVFQDNHHSRFEGYRDESTILVQWLPNGERQVIWPQSLAEGEIVPPPWWEGWTTG